MASFYWTKALAAVLVVAGGAAHATPPQGVAPLLNQAQFWLQRGRGDRAKDAYRRVLAIDPDNVTAKNGLAKIESPPVGAASGGAAVTASGARPPRSRRGHQRGPAGPARAAGFSALARNDLAAAAEDFHSALRTAKVDHDALGGLGLVRLRQQRFDEARDLLARASNRGEGAKWADALRSARFYATLNAALAARAAGDEQSAEAMTRALLEQSFDPDGAGESLLADILQQSGRYDAAADAYDAAAHAASDVAKGNIFQAKAVRARAEQAQAQGDDDRGAALLSAGIDRFPTDPWLRHDLAQILLSERRTDEALAAIKPLRSATQTESLFAAALVLAQADRLQEASDLMARAPAAELEGPMRDLVVRLSVGKAILRAKELAAQGQTLEALDGLRKIASNPKLPVAALGALADEFTVLGEPAEASHLALRAAALPKAQPGDYAAVLAVLGRTGEIRAGCALISTLTPANPASAPIELRRLTALFAAASADHLRLQQQYATAFDLLKQAWSVAPNDPDLLAATARLYQSGKLNEQAAQVFAMWVKAQPDSVDAWLGLAQTSLAAGLSDQAHRAAAEAVRRSPADAQVLFAAAKIEAARGDKKLALVYFRQAEKVLSRATLLADGSAFPPVNPFKDQGSANTLPGAAAGIRLADAGLPSPVTPALGGAASPFVLASAAGASGGGGSNGVDQTVAAPGGGGQANDPTLQAIEKEVANLSEGNRASAVGTVGLRSRSGESGLSALNEVSADVTAHVPLGGATVSVSASPVVLEAGSLSASALARFGFNATPAGIAAAGGGAAALSSVSAPQASGAAFSAKLENGPLTASVGTTPLGFDHVNFTGDLRLKLKPSDTTTFEVYAERAPVTDSVLSYAGEKDPVSGRTWGAVVRNQAGVSYSYGSAGIGAYAQADAREYQGFSVKENYAGEFNAGAYVTLLQNERSHLTVGANVNVQGYQHDEDFFTFGNGGYFSPQSFASLSVPIRYDARLGQWSLALDFSPGLQEFSQAAAPVYPTDHAAQAFLNALNAANSVVRSAFDSTAARGGALFGDAKASYPIAPGALISGEVSYNSFGAFNELEVQLTMKKTFGTDAQ